MNSKQNGKKIIMLTGRLNGRWVIGTTVEKNELRAKGPGRNKALGIPLVQVVSGKLNHRPRERLCPGVDIEEIASFADEGVGTQDIPLKA